MVAGPVGSHGWSHTLGAPSGHNDWGYVLCGGDDNLGRTYQHVAQQGSEEKGTRSGSSSHERDTRSTTRRNSQRSISLKTPVTA
ncbi:hypothetical protein I7I53_06977 [Histoplasma capsulatum var. duboisii H88]|uniref:Uncharacterized protein n=1 Tax=Ajellomyces capsulatus (strain H88) TaxID=544711 RepID=A0A8A1LI11_AJEC8|nr:hypothetical protein I7I53_06977 [Histoplasma capsulatum var. duboisii H88]